MMKVGKIDPGLAFFAVLLAVGGVWGLLTGSILIPHRRGSTTYEFPGSLFVSLALLLLSVLFAFWSFRIKVKRGVLIVVCVVSALLIASGMIVGPTVR